MFKTKQKKPKKVVYPPQQPMGKRMPIEDLLNFELQDDHVIAGGQKVYFIRYYPPNLSIMTESEVEDEIRNMTVLLDTLRRRLSLFITDKVEDLEGNKRFWRSMPSQYEYITSEIVSKMMDVEVKSTSVQRSFYFVYKPENDSDDIYNTLKGKGYTVERTKKHELAVLLRNYLLREFINYDIYTIEQEIKNHPKMKKASQLIYNREIQRRLSPHRIDFKIHHAEQNNYYRKVIMTKNFPSEIPPAALLQLASIRGTTFNMRLTPMDKGTARKLVDQQSKNIQMKRGGKNKTNQIDAEQEQEVIEAFYADLNRNQNAIYHTNIFIEMYGKTRDDLREIENRVKSELAALAITYEELRYEQQNGFQSVQPLGRDMFLADSNNMPSPTVAALYPCSFSSRQDEKGMPLGTTEQGGNMILDLLQRTDTITNGHFTVTGQSGQGKSYLMKKIITFLTVMGAWCFSLDPEDEYKHLFRELGGTVLNCSNGSVRINPFEVRTLKTPDDDEDDGLEYINPNTPIFFQHLSWLTDFFQVLFPEMSVIVRKALMKMVKDMYRTFGISENSDFSSLKSTDYPTFTNLWEYMNNPTDTNGRPVNYSDLISPEQLQEAKLFIEDCYDGSLGAVLNGHTNMKNDKMICFALGELLEGSKERAQAVLFNITTYIWNIVSKKQNNVLLNIDELYLFLENPIMVKYIRSFAKRGRKYNALLGIGTQQLADCLQPEIATYSTALFNNASFQFMFHPGKIDLDRATENLKLTNGEENTISVPNKRHCLVRAGSDRYYMEVGAFEYEALLFGKGGGV